MSRVRATYRSHIQRVVPEPPEDEWLRYLVAEKGFTLPEAPRSTVDVSMPTVLRTVNVSSTAEIAAALSDVRHGDEIVVAAGTYTYTGDGIAFPSLPAGDRAIIRGENAPPTGQRISPLDNVPVFEAPGNAVFRFGGTEGWYVIGFRLECSSTSTSHNMANAISTYGDPAHRIVFDRIYTYASGVGDASRRMRRGILMNGSHLAAINCRVEGVVGGMPGADQQSNGINSYDGPGPFLIENCFLETSWQNILFGGARPTTLPADATIRHNHTFKRKAWEIYTAGHPRSMIEVKEGRRVQIYECLAQDLGSSGGGRTGLTCKPADTGQETVGISSCGDIDVRRMKYQGLYDQSNVGVAHNVGGSSNMDRVLVQDIWFTDNPSGAASGLRIFKAPDNYIVQRITANGTHSCANFMYLPEEGSAHKGAFDSLRMRCGSWGIGFSDGAGGMTTRYPSPGHVIRDWWQFWDDHGTNYCFRSLSVPDTIDEEYHDELYCQRYEAGIPSDIGANQSVIDSALTNNGLTRVGVGVADPDLPGED
jgi:hypothetical protein